MQIEMNDNKHFMWCRAIWLQTCITIFQELCKEVSSLNIALEMKSAEMKELRRKNADLQLKAEEIQSKDVEISILKHRLQEAKEIIERKVQTEK